MSDRRGDWIQTFTGKMFYPLDPRPEDVCIEDIAHALSNICRFNGHVTAFYSVAQHSVLVSNLLPPGQRLWGLLHDASEAYLCDVPRPLKYLPEFAAYREAENVLEGVIAERFKLPIPMPESVRHADRVMLATEKRDLLTDGPGKWREGVAPHPRHIIPLLPRYAKDCFFAEYTSLRWESST